MKIALLLLMVINQPTAVIRTKDAKVALEAFRQSLRDWATGRSGPTNAKAALDEVEAAIFRHANALQDRYTDDTEWRSIAGDIFEEIPQLPPETKKDGRYILPNVRFRLKPSNLFVRAIRFQGSRTMRLHSVTLFFQDGSKVSHPLWAKRDTSQGEEFPKEKWTPHLPAYLPNEQPQARRLMAIEVIGSGQDKNYKAELEIQFEIPKPHPADATAAMRQVARMRETLQQGQRAIPELSNQARQLETLINQLGR